MLLRRHGDEDNATPQTSRVFNRRDQEARSRTLWEQYGKAKHVWASSSKTQTPKEKARCETNDDHETANDDRETLESGTADCGSVFGEYD